MKSYKQQRTLKASKTYAPINQQREIKKESYKTNWKKTKPQTEDDFYKKIGLKTYVNTLTSLVKLDFKKSHESHNYPNLSYLVIVHDPKFITIHNESKLLIGVIQVCHPLHVDVVMATIEQTFKCLELNIKKWWVAIIV